MARGGHHGGGFHGGGHHFSGGGFHGGGGFSGGGYHGGSGGGGGGDPIGFIGEIVIFGLVLLGYFVYAVAEGEIPGLNLINLGMFVASGVFFYLALKDYGRQDAIYRPGFQAYETEKAQVWKADYKNYAPRDSVSDKVSWASIYDNKYRIAFYDRDFGEENKNKVKDLIKRTPKIIWMTPFVWLVIAFFVTASNAVFYEWLIPYFETRVMTDEAFAFVDELIFYTPAGVTLLLAIASFAFKIVRDSLLHKCAMRIVKDNNAAYERMKTEGFIISALSNKWYYNNCPNCGVDAGKDMRFCNHCGSSLEVKGKEYISAVHRISAQAEDNDKEPVLKRHTD